MPNSVALITVHGMGRTPQNYADGLFELMRQRLGASHQFVHFGAVYYQQILQQNQETIWTRVTRDAEVDYHRLRKFVLFGFGDAAGLENHKELEGSVYELAQGEIAKTMLAAYDQSKNPDLKVVLLSQSLGCQVMSNYIYDAQKAAWADETGNPGARPKAGIWKDIDAWAKGTLNRTLDDAEKKFIAANSCMAWITTGCNIPIFIAAHRDMHIKPIEAPTGKLFRWINFYDRDDVLGWPLQPLSEGYKQLVEDREINAGNGLDSLVSWTPASHSAYWADKDVLKTLTTMLQQLAM